MDIFDRSDVKVEYTWATTDQASRMFKHFFPKCTDLDAEMFGLAFKDKQVTMCEIQELLVSARGESDKAFENLETIGQTSPAPETSPAIPLPS